MKHTVPPATLSVMTGKVAKQFLFWRWQADHWETLPRTRGLAEFAKRFQSFAHPMVVVAPDFSRFDSKYDQTFGYLPLARLATTRTGYAEDEIALFRRCLERLSRSRASGAEVALVDGSLLVDDGRRWSVPLTEVERRVELISRRSCCERILPALAAGIGADAGGVYAPYEGPGVFCLSSM